MPTFPDLSDKTGDDGETALFCGKRVPKTDPRIRIAGQVDLALAALGRTFAHLDASDPLQDELRVAFELLQRRFLQLMREVNTREKQKEAFVQEQDQVGKADVAACEHYCEKVRAALIEKGVEYDADAIFGARSAAAADFYYLRAVLRETELGLWSLRKQGFTIRDPLIKLINRTGDLLLYCAYYANGR